MKLENIWKRIQKTESCWLWGGSIDRDGYGYLSHGDKKSARAHRVLYELEVGPIPEGLEIDHRCRVRNCVNPKHLEPVTGAENQRRRIERRVQGPKATPNQLRLAKGICRAGHNMNETGRLTSVQKDGTIKTRCTLCQHETQERNRRKNGLEVRGRRGAYGPRN